MNGFLACRPHPPFLRIVLPLQSESMLGAFGRTSRSALDSWEDLRWIHEICAESIKFALNPLDLLWIHEICVESIRFPLNPWYLRWIHEICAESIRFAPNPLDLRWIHEICAESIGWRRRLTTEADDGGWRRRLTTGTGAFLHQTYCGAKNVRNYFALTSRWIDVTLDWRHAGLTSRWIDVTRFELDWRHAGLTSRWIDVTRFELDWRQCNLC